MARKAVLLYSPHYVAPALRSGRQYLAMPPFSLLALAGPLRDAGYDVRILDAKWDANWRDHVRSAAGDLVCAGVTSLTGPAVSDGLEFASFVKQIRPDIPVIWGGWHATFAARQAIQDPRVDAVVHGIGERTMVELVRAIENGDSLRKVRGISFREGSGVVTTGERPTEDINHFPPPAYELIDPKRYVMQGERMLRKAATIFSRGCPYACDFCLDSRSRWLGLSVDRMLADMEFWCSQGANHIQFYDGNFFLARARLVEFCNALLARDLPSRIHWTATAVGRRIAGMDDELLGLLRRAGLEQVAIGAESGSDELLSRITNKTNVESTLEAVRRLTRHGINQYLFFMIGYPDEPADALERTLEFIVKLKGINPALELCLNYTTPLPGSEVFRIAVERGLVAPPRTFEDWARFDYVKPNLQGIPAEYTRHVRLFERFLNLAYPLKDRMQPPALLRKIARWRIANQNYAFPVELAALSASRFVRQAIAQ